MSTRESDKPQRLTMVCMVDPSIAHSFAPSSSSLALAQSTNSSSSSNPVAVSIHELPDPSTGEKRPYVVIMEQPHEGSNESTTTTVRKNTISVCELQALPPTAAPYGSFLVARDFNAPEMVTTTMNYVIGGSGDLHVVTAPMDPLWWCLRDEFLMETSSEPNKKVQWQPLPQIRELLFSASSSTALLAHCLPPPPQLSHLFDTMRLGDDDDDEEELFYKFSVPKTLQWLQQKQERVYQVLLQQELAHQQTAIAVAAASCTSTTSTGSGAFVSGFSLGDEPEIAVLPASPAADEQQQAAARQELTQRARDESMQVVCQYLTAAWQTVFLQHIGVCAEQVLVSPAQQRKRKRQPAAQTQPCTVDGATNDENEPGSGEKKNKSIPRSVTAGAKRLSKVNTKGMSKMSSFFTVVKTKK